VKKIITSLLCLTIFVSFTQNAGASFNLFCRDWEKAYDKCVSYNKEFAENIKQCVENMHVYENALKKYNSALEKCQKTNNMINLSAFISTFTAFASGIYIGRHI
jgi:hypothetical protein